MWEVCGGGGLGAGCTRVPAGILEAGTLKYLGSTCSGWWKPLIPPAAAIVACFASTLCSPIPLAYIPPLGPPGKGFEAASMCEPPLLPLVILRGNEGIGGSGSVKVLNEPADRSYGGVSGSTAVMELRLLITTGVEASLYIGSDDTNLEGGKNP